MNRSLDTLRNARRVARLGPWAAILSATLGLSCSQSRDPQGNQPAVPPGSVSEPSASASCRAPAARTPIRRLSGFEYDNTVRDLLGDDTSPASALPGEVQGNGFGNDAEQQSVSSLLAQQYIAVAEGIAARATAASSLSACVDSRGPAPTAPAEAQCVSSFLQELAPRAYRRPLQAGELEELLGLFQSLRMLGRDVRGAVQGVIEAILLTPGFVYRPELGTAATARPGSLRPTGHEMATRLSYLYWGTMPDSELTAAAARGELDTADGARAHAKRLLNDTRSEKTIRYFFDNLLPISRASSLARDPSVYPTFSPHIGALMREETQTFLKHVIFDAGGSFSAILTAPYTFVNAELAAFYGFPNVTGEQFQQVPLDTSKRLGLLTQGGIMAGTVATNHTNPVSRAVFLMRKVLCQDLPRPPAALAKEIKPPDPYGGATARERFGAHSQNAICAGCHRNMDPIGLALENLDAVGLWRDTENDVPIDATGEVAVLGAAFNGPVELIQRIAASPAAKSCFADQWLSYAYGRALGSVDACSAASVHEAFERSGGDVREMLVALSQTPAFLYINEGED